MKNLVKVRVPGSCGELLQGIINGENVLISCPISLYSYLTLKRMKYFDGIKIDNNKIKTEMAIRKTMEYYGVKTFGIEVIIESELLVEKGMASSSADIVAGIIATMVILEKPVDLELVTQLAVAIEPTDPCYYKGVIAFDHFSGKVLKNLGSIKEYPIIILDSGGKVNTIQFNANRKLLQLKIEKEEEIKEGYQSIASGFEKNSIDLIGFGMHLSALAHQKILKKINLEDFIEFAKNEESIFGVNVAHSGTIIGVIIKSKEDIELIENKISESFKEYKHLRTTTLSNEGYQILKVEN